MVGVTISLTLKGPAEESRFLAVFGKALEHVSRIPGLKQFQAAKVIGQDFSYQVFSLWESEEAIEAWLQNPTYRDHIRKGGEELVAKFESYRWRPIREPKRIP